MAGARSPSGGTPGQEDDAERRDIVANPPDILLTNYMMAELILTRVHEQGLVCAAQGLQFPGPR